MAKLSVELILWALASLTLVYGQKKDILFIAIDDYRTDMGAYGHEEVLTPNMDCLAAKSLLFERAYCQVSVCSPSRASLLTSRRPDTNHVWLISPDEYWRRTTNATTIPQYFKENGYVSIGMGKIFHPGPASGNDDIEYSWSLPYFHGRDEVSGPRASWHSYPDITDNMLKDGQIADQAVATLKEIMQNRSNGNTTPFFLATGFHKPHLPFDAPSKYYDLYPPAEEIKPPSNPDAPKEMPSIAWSNSFELRGYRDLEEYDLPECYDNIEAAMYGDNCKIAGVDALTLRRAYYAAISYTDAQIGRVLDELEAQGLASNTIIVLWGDHGFKLGELNMWSKFTNMEYDTRVPFLLRVPGVTDSGMRTQALVELVDIFPSLTELAGIPVPPVCPEDNEDLLACVEGTSVVPLLEDTQREWKEAAYSQYARPSVVGFPEIPGHPPFERGDNEAVMGYAVRSDEYRFIEWYSFDRDTATPDFSEVWGTELYDKDETINKAADPEMAEIVNKMRHMLQDGWRDTLSKI